MRRLAIAVSMVCLGALAASAADAPLYKTKDCSKEMVQMGMNMCSGANLDAANAELNRDYAKVMAQQTDQPSKDQLKDLERNWMAYRDKECAFEIGPQDQGGSIWPMDMNDCLRRVTDVRIRELKSMIDCQEGDVACRK